MKVHFVVVCDEESDEQEQRASDFLVEKGYIGDFAITGEPTDLHIGVQAKGVLVLRLLVSGPLGARLHAVAGRQRGGEGRRRLPQHRVAAVRARVLRPLRPPLDQPRQDHRRRRGEPRAGLLHDRPRHPLPAGPGPRRHHRRGRRAARHRGHEGLPPRSDRGLARRALRAGSGRGGVEGEPGGVEHRGRPRRHVRRHLLPQRRHPGCRVRPDRGWSPWARRVGFDPVARRISAGAGRVRQPDPGRRRASPT